MNFIRKHKIILLVFLALFAVMTIGPYLYVSRLMNSMQKIADIDKEEMTNPNLSQETKEIMKGYWTIALFGVDSRDGDLGKGTLSDVEIICNIDRATGEIRLVSVYRDTLLKVSKKDKYDKINSAYLMGGPSQAVWALSENLDMSFDDCVAFNWKAVADAINILGGIDIDITKDEFKLINGYITETVKSTGVYSTQLTHAGMNHLDGVQSVAYARLRKLDTDFKRTERQRTVIEKALEKAKKADFAALNNILVTVLPQMSSTITINDLIPMAKNITRYHIGVSEGFPFQLTDKMLGKKDVVVPVTLESNVKKLHEILYKDFSYETSAKVREISDRIGELSGTGGGKTTTSGIWSTGDETMDDEPESRAQTKPSTENIDDEIEKNLEGGGLEESSGSGDEPVLHPTRPHETQGMAGPGSEPETATAKASERGPGTTEASVPEPEAVSKPVTPPTMEGPGGKAGSGTSRVLEETVEEVGPGI